MFSRGISTGIASSIGTAASTGKGPLNEILALVFIGILQEHLYLRGSSMTILQVAYQ